MTLILFVMHPQSMLVSIESFGPKNRERKRDPPVSTHHAIIRACCACMNARPCAGGEVTCASIAMGVSVNKCSHCHVSMR